MIARPTSIAVTCDFRAEAVAIRQVELPAVPAEFEEFVDARWEREVELNPHLHAGPVVSVAAVHAGEDKLVFDCGASDYRQFMGTTWPHIPEPYRRKALGQMAVTITNDDQLVLGVRSRTIDWGGLRHAVPAGRVQPDEGTPLEALLLEFREEASTGFEEIDSLRCIGVLENHTPGRMNYEIVYLARVRCSASEYVERVQSAECSWEHDRIEAYAWDRETVSGLLTSEAATFTPSGFGGIAMALRHVFGADAFPDWEVRPMAYEDYMGIDQQAGS